MELGHTRASKPSSRDRNWRSTPKGLPASAPAQHSREAAGHGNAWECQQQCLLTRTFRVASDQVAAFSNACQLPNCSLRLTRSQGQGTQAGQQVAQPLIVTLPGRCMAQQPVAPPHRLWASEAGKTTESMHLA